ncbi:MAG: FtsX-like permease family protein [Nitrospinaceae bacterium]
MIRWLLKGIARDKTRSLFPFIVVTVGVALVIVLIGFMDGIITGLIDMTANLDTGHIRFVNKPFYDEEHLNPMDRALASQKETGRWLRENSGGDIQWSPRIRWGAIMDVPDEQGETKSQTPVVGMALDLLSPDSPELKRLQLEESLTEGRLPRISKEALVGYQLANNLGIELNDTVTLIGQSFDGGLAADNFTVVGFIRFGVFAMDKKMALIDLADGQDAFYMEDMVTDWLGYLPAHSAFDRYKEIKANLVNRLADIKENPPKGWAADDDPIVLSVLDQRNIGAIVDKFLTIRKFIIGIFLALMVLVLWNAGVLNGIHRYGEMGLRLAMGETHGRMIASLVLETFMIGVLGSIAGSILGGAFAWYLQEVGLNMGDNFAQTGLMLNDVVRARLSAGAFLRGIIPGLTATVIGTLFASAAIFKRTEANLFRELEAG